MSSCSALERISQSQLVPAIRASTAERAEAIATAIAAGGIQTLEIPLTVPGALTVIHNLRQDHPALTVGAGTVLDAVSARMSILAGAQFIVTPALRLDVIACCRLYSVPILCGALTPSEILNAWEAGADLIKVFPASALGGAPYMKALKGPLPHIGLMPMGGVSLATATGYLEAGACALGVGADLTDICDKSASDLSPMKERAAQYVQVVAEHRRTQHQPTTKE